MRLQAILRLKCPHCCQGDVFRRPFVMHRTCPHCGIEYERERGYFMMSVFVGYVMSFFVVIPVLLGLYLTVRPSLNSYLLGAIIALVLAIPLIFHYARVIWMHLDELMDPRQFPPT